jgi:hypothetical protein
VSAFAPRGRAGAVQVHMGAGLGYKTHDGRSPARSGWVVELVLIERVESIGQKDLLSTLCDSN